ncbi:MAG TPA: RNA 2',3'-cyclic phosphodiesterase [Bryobacteraceae bacterium]|nr:RNA 2',3'-cyclic phosphodiesterase [Bryobacteraceae bacterium]
MRLFTAIDLPPEVVRHLEKLLETLKPTARIAWSRPSNLHVTTKFIGEWPEERLEELKRALASIGPRSRISVSISNLGFFPNARSPRVFWCGVDAPGLGALAAATEDATASLGVARENRAFSPHLTLARIKERINLKPLDQAIARLREANSSLHFGSFPVDRFYLYQSKLDPAGSVYTKLAEFPFSQP